MHAYMKVSLYYMYIYQFNYICCQCKFTYYGLLMHLMATYIEHINCIVLYCIYPFLERFSQPEPFRSAPDYSN